MSIKFGTDGWRGLMTEDFTEENVALVAQAVCNYISSDDLAGKGLIIGYDTRNQSEKFAKVCCEVASANGIATFISPRPLPTPLTAFAIGVYESAGAIMITASHNPPDYNGIKFIPYYQSPAEDNIIAKIENEISNLDYEDVKTCAFENNPLVNIVNPIPEYIEKIKSIVDFNLLYHSNLSLIVDSMHGASAGIIDKVFIDLGIKTNALRQSTDPYFGGDTPEPIERHLVELSEKVKAEGKLGLALDGDADRFGAFDSNGKFIPANYLLAIMAHYLVKVKKVKGDIARSVATTHLLDLIAEKNGLDLVETKVGFKHLGKVMRERDIAIAAEESAGMSIYNHIPEKDGLLAVALLAEVYAYYKKPLTEVLDAIFQEYGFMKSSRIDTEVTPEKKKDIMKKLTVNPPKAVDGLEVTGKKDTDGLKLEFNDGSWMLIRPSGTEPKIRTYIEAPTDASFIKLENFVRTTV